MKQLILNRFQKWAITKGREHGLTLVPSGNWVRAQLDSGESIPLMTYSFVDKVCSEGLPQ